MYSFRRTLLTFPPYLLALIFGVLASFGVMDGGAWGAIGIVGALLMTLLVGAGQGRMPWPSKPALLFIVLGLGAAAASSFEAIAPDQAWKTTLKMLTIFVPLAFLSSPDLQNQGRFTQTRIKWIARVMAVSFILVACGLIATYNLLGYDDLLATRLSRGFSYAALLFWPLMACLVVRGRYPRTIIALTLTLLLALCLTHSRATQVGMLAAIGVFGIARVWPVLARRGLYVAVVGLFAWPWCVPVVFERFHSQFKMLPESWRHRMEIWDNLSYRLADNLFFGQGIGNTDKIEVISPHSSLYQITDGVASHPHNLAVQLWAETGVLGVVFGLYACFWALKAIKRLSNTVKPYAYAAFTLGLALSMLAYNFWTDSLMAAYALTAFSFAVLIPQKPIKA